MRCRENSLVEIDEWSSAVAACDYDVTKLDSPTKHIATRFFVSAFQSNRSRQLPPGNFQRVDFPRSVAGTTQLMATNDDAGYRGRAASQRTLLFREMSVTEIAKVDDSATVRVHGDADFLN